MKILPAMLLAVGLLLTLSCAHLQPELSAGAKPDGNAAVLFGRFSVGHNFAFENKLALWLENTESKHLALGMTPAQSVFHSAMKTN